ncbi:Tn3 family transposase ISPsy42 [Ralstonia edaphis]|nr:Tn3 family transposase ISPsy42 [Ralstonia sp. LMG 6871]
MNHYAGLANFYTVFDLRRMAPEQANLYLLCLIWQRFRQFTDTLVDAVGFHTRKLEDETKTRAQQAFIEQQLKQRRESPRLGRLLLLYVDGSVADSTPFGTVRRRAFKIMPRTELEDAGRRLSKRTGAQLALRWEAVDQLAARVRRHLRPLFDDLEPASVDPASPWLAALNWMKGVFAARQRLSQRPFAEIPADTVPKRLQSYLLTFDAAGQSTGVNADRYEFWVFRQLRRRLHTGEIHLDDSH